VVQVVEPTGSELQVVATLGDSEIIAVFRERHQFKPGDKIRLKPDPRLFICLTRRRVSVSPTKKAEEETSMSY
jgi:ABC-type sugar transport system ATPase subunit